ncbi:CpsD/CapB family tyrosine-protein kinase [Robertmurraya korlensis]|uniref:CpsD/CapB family tyrosine-protein kinase n=1 Tax=Robertmurraya korlensis TaxID=519977 RepID=UPI00203FA7DC|nr:CpsD/CapB family tyrosine-protein kinase [Robertmurraya korlensis]MCM3602186.1 CpsD/CapB family tyrosine-protein kinase [Robertmurraya korlensis]
MAFKKEKKAKVSDFKRKLVVKNDPKSPVSEQYRTIRTNIQFSTVDHEIRTLMVTSSGPGEGKSTTAANLATVFAQQGNKVLLVDADMRKPTVHYTFSLMNTSGLTTILKKQSDLHEAATQIDSSNLFVLPCGPVPPNPAELISSRSMDEFIEVALNEFDMVIFDSPPVLVVTDAQLLANKCDGTVLVVSSNFTEKENALKAKEQLTASKAKLLGVILNNKKQDKSQYYYYYGGK